MINIDKKAEWQGYSQYNTWSQEDQNAFKSWLADLLRSGIVDLTFVKKDGTIRKMRATLQEDLIATTKGTGKVENNETIAVTDVDINEWRSIRYNSINEIKFTLE